MSGRAAGNPDAQRVVLSLAFNNRRVDCLAEGFEGCRVAEETGDLDQHILIQCGGLLRVLSQVVGILGQLIQLVDRHAAQDASTDSGALVTDIIKPQSFQVIQYLFDHILVQFLKDFS